MIKIRNLSAVLLIAAVMVMICICGLKGVSAAVFEEVNSAGGNETQDIFGKKDAETILNQMQQTQKIFYAAKEAAEQKYGEEYVSVKKKTDPPVLSRAAKSKAVFGTQIYSQELKPSVAGITVVRYYPTGGYDILLNWTEGILGASSGERLYCADPSAGFSAGYKSSVPGTYYFSQYTIDFVAAVFYYYDNYMCLGLNDDQDYIMKQIAFWYFANMSANWYPGCYFEFSSNYYCGYGHNLFEHRAELLDGAGLKWASENYEKMDADMTVFEGQGQPLMKLDYQFETTGSLRMKKISANQEITGENACYSLAGAEYGVYTEKECINQIGTLTTEENGESNSIEVKEGKWYVKEIKAPPGYALDPNVYEVAVTGNRETELKVYDAPALDPAEILLIKKDKENGADEEKMSLEGARFEVKYYKGIFTEDPEKLGKVPARSWIFQTDGEGRCRLNESYLISGDELYRFQSGEPGMPLGTVTVREILPPQGYLLNGNVYVVNINGDSGGSERVSFYQTQEISEERLRIKILKIIKDQEQTVPGAVFRHTFPDHSTETVVTDKNGEAVVESLLWGQHIIEEVSAPDGLMINPGRVVFTVEKGNKIVVNENTATEKNGIISFTVNESGNISMTAEDRLVPYKLSVYKTNENGTPLEGAEFTLYSDRECKNVLQTKVSDKEGNILFTGLENEVKYYIKETKAPEGYRIPLNKDGSLKIYEIYTKSNPIKGEFEYFLNSEKCPEIKGTAAERTVCLQVENHTMPLLPETGSPWTAAVWTGGMLCLITGLMLSGYIRIRKRGMTKMKKKRRIIYGMIMFAVISVCMETVGEKKNLLALAATCDVSGKEVSSINGTAVLGNGSAAITVRGNGSQTLQGKRFHVYQLFSAENSRDGESVNYTFCPVYEEAVRNVTAYALSEQGKQIEPENVTEYMAIDYIQSLNQNPVEGAGAEQVKEGYYSKFRYYVENLRNEIVSLGIVCDTVVADEINADNSLRITGLAYGYYILDEVSYVDGTHSAASLCMVDTANPSTEMNVKSDYPSVQKKIQEDDESEDITDSKNWNDIGDFEIGQNVPYKFTSNIPDINGYDTYYYAWHDKMDPALTLKRDTVKIMIAGKEEEKQKIYELAPEEFRLNYLNNSSEETFCVEIEDVKKILDREFNNKDDRGHNIYGQEVILEYKAVLNEHAANDTGRPGFENDVRLEFSNDADGNGTGSTGYTPWDTVVCFTYQLEVTKLNEHGKALSGAKFRLYSDEDCGQEVYVKRLNDGYAVINRDFAGGNDHTGGTIPEDAVEMVSGEDGIYTIYGLDTGTYYLKETDAPDGYRKLKDPIVIEVKAEYTDKRDDYIKGQGKTDQTLRKLSVTAHIKSFYNSIVQKETTELQSDEEKGKANLTVVNQVGKKLPVTGTVTVLFMFVTGVGLMAFASVQTRRKKKNEKEMGI